MGGLNSTPVYQARLGIVLSVLLLIAACDPTNSTIKVGVLHSLTGTMAESEKPVAMATMMAIDEINRDGGLLGRQIEPILYDGQSDDKQFFRLAKTLIQEDNASTVFGCWTSSCRKTIKPLFEGSGRLLVYPVQFEGVEASPNILYTGSTAAQQVMPALAWGLKNIGPRVMLVGSDYVFPRIANVIASNQVTMLGGEVVDEVYFLLGDERLQGLLARVQAAKPDFIFSTLNGSSNREFYRLLASSNEQTAVIATSISESDLNIRHINFPVYVANSYFQSLPRVENRDFITRFKAFAGENMIVSAAVEAAYTGVYLWAHAVRLSNSFHTNDVIHNLTSLSVDGPADRLVVAIDTNHVWRKFYLAKLDNLAGFSVIYTDLEYIPPTPYPVFFSKRKWHQYLDDLYIQWGEKWQAVAMVADTK
ncbi:MAG TPA: transporter substrate-binding protein [Pseudomonadales bacterium]|nr:transporter substrate-binding protein [Pseudomonadales bacterium]